jgi:hypothetical protein
LAGCPSEIGSAFHDRAVVELDLDDGRHLVEAGGLGRADAEVRRAQRLHIGTLTTCR